MTHGLLLTLPHSHIELDLPLIGSFPGVAEPDAGLIPDVMVPKTAAHVISGSDREMAVVRQLLKSAKPDKRSIGKSFYTTDDDLKSFGGQPWTSDFRPTFSSLSETP